MEREQLIDALTQLGFELINHNTTFYAYWRLTNPNQYKFISLVDTKYVEIRLPTPASLLQLYRLDMRTIDGCEYGGLYEDPTKLLNGLLMMVTNKKLI